MSKKYNFKNSAGLEMAELLPPENGHGQKMKIDFTSGVSFHTRHDVVDALAASGYTLIAPGESHIDYEKPHDYFAHGNSVIVIFKGDAKDRVPGILQIIAEQASAYVSGKDIAAACEAFGFPAPVERIGTEIHDPVATLMTIKEFQAAAKSGAPGRH